MPIQINSSEDFQKLLATATEVRVVKRAGSAKVKLRTKGALYTFVTTEDEVETLTKGTKIPIVEF
jgi:hypothetical protein